jgi:hypothetical protein
LTSPRHVGQANRVGELAPANLPQRGTLSWCIIGVETTGPRLTWLSLLLPRWQEKNLIEVCVRDP